MTAPPPLALLEQVESAFLTLDSAAIAALDYSAIGDRLQRLKPPGGPP